MWNFVNLQNVREKNKNKSLAAVLLGFQFVNENITNYFIDSTNPDVDIKISLICKAGLKIKPNIDSHGHFGGHFGFISYHELL